MLLLTGARLTSVLAGFLTSVIGAHLIGASGLGIAGAALTAATIAALITNGGLNIATVYFLGQRPNQAGQIVGWVTLVGTVASLLAALVVAAAGLVFGQSFFKTQSVSLIVVTAALAAGLLAFELSGGVLLGLHRRMGYIGTQMIEALSSLALTVVILVALDRSATGYLAAAAGGYWLGIAGAAILARTHLGHVSISLDRRFTIEALRMGIRGQAGNILQFLNLRLDLLLVPALLNFASAGVYLVAVRISEVVTQVASSASAFLFPHVASQIGDQSTELTERTTRLTALFVVGTGIVLGALATPILAAFFGPEFERGAWTVRITLLAMLPLSVVRVLAGDLKGRGRPGLVSAAALVALVVTVVLDLTLIPPLGIAGAALASLLSYTTSAVALLIAYRAVTRTSLARLVPGPSDLVAVTRMARRIARGSRPGGG